MKIMITNTSARPMCETSTLIFCRYIILIPLPPPHEPLQKKLWAPLALCSPPPPPPIQNCFRRTCLKWWYYTFHQTCDVSDVDSCLDASGLSHAAAVGVLGHAHGGSIRDRRMLSDLSNGLENMCSHMHVCPCLPWLTLQRTRDVTGSFFNKCIFLRPANIISFDQMGYIKNRSAAENNL